MKLFKETFQIHKKLSKNKYNDYILWNHIKIKEPFIFCYSHLRSNHLTFFLFCEHHKILSIFFYTNRSVRLIAGSNNYFYFTSKCHVDNNMFFFFFFVFSFISHIHIIAIFYIVIFTNKSNRPQFTLLINSINKSKQIDEMFWFE